MVKPVNLGSNGPGVRRGSWLEMCSASINVRYAAFHVILLACYFLEGRRSRNPVLGACSATGGVIQSQFLKAVRDV